MTYEHIMRDVMSTIKDLKGVQQVSILTDEDKRKVLELERQAEKRFMGLGRGNNQGVKTVLERDIVIAFVTDAEYRWPPGPNLILFWKGKVIGEEVTDPKKLEKLKNKTGVYLAGNFALYKNNMPKPSLMIQEPPLIVFPPKPFPEIKKKVPAIHDVVIGSPSPSSDNYLKKRMKVDLENKQLGTALLGFNSE